MEPTTIIVSALAAGAAAALKPTAAQVVKDAYAFLKAVLSRKFASIELKALESKPDSAVKQASLKEDLEGTTAARDGEVLDAVNKLVDALSVHDPAAAELVGVDLVGVRAASLSIGNVSSTGTGVRIHSSEFSGDIKVGDVAAGGGNGFRDPR